MTTADSSKDKNGRNFTIRDRNAAFDALAAADKRIAIAKDVIQQVLLGKLLPESGIYVSSSEDQCRVCAIGAVAVSLANGNARKECTAALSTSVMSLYFHPDDLRQMEAAFEGYNYETEHGHDTDIAYRDFWSDWGMGADSFEDKDNERTRLLVIFTNIVNNGGEFVAENLDNEIKAFHRDGAAYWYATAGVAQPVSGQ